MSSTPLISLSEIKLAFGDRPLLENADLAILPRERIGLIGRNGTGKSSLLKIINGRQAPDAGDITQISGLRIATVEQEPDLDPDSTIVDLLNGDYIDTEDWARPARAGMLIDELGLAAEARIATLSGGNLKRVALAKALVEEPDLLLLDEPTNHLDFDGIVWLEKHLAQCRFSVVLITHDRRFLDAVTTRIIELDRGQLHSFPGNFSQWQKRKAEWLEAEAQQEAQFDKLLAQEEEWLRRGVKARRARNEGRVRRLEQLRRERAQRRERQGNVNLAVAEGQRSGKLVAELKNIYLQFGDKCIVRDFSTTVMRQDRIGIVGPNGAGKTTLLRILLGELKPDRGEVRLGTGLNIAYFDQMRELLDEELSVVETISPGSEWIEIGDERKHVMTYLGDFLFSPARSRSPVSSLSGGERARLALARLFARPANILVLDEPTNDLDIETLELLEQLLLDYNGTVLLVSHDRSFLDNIVTQIIAAEGDGHWQEYVGGYDDWLAQRPNPVATKKAKKSSPVAAKTKAPSAKKASSSKQQSRRGGRLSSWEEKELEEIPDAIAAIEKQQAELAKQLADDSLYRDEPEKIDTINAQLKELEAELETLFERWETLEAKQD